MYLKSQNGRSLFKFKSSIIVDMFSIYGFFWSYFGTFLHSQKINTLRFKFILQDIEKPMKLGSRVHTVVQHKSSKAEDYPGRSDKKEITSIDNTDLKTVS